MTTLYLIRHGETPNNKHACYNGCRSDQPISDRGVAQAKYLSAALEDTRIDAIYCSPLRRARQTAEILCGTRALPLQVRQEIREMDMGALDGVSFEEARRTHPDIPKNWNSNPDAVQMPDGENFGEVLDRALPAIFEIVRENRGKTVAVVAHGTLLRLVTAALFGLPVARKSEVENLFNTAYHRLEIDDSGFVTVSAYNEHAHLPTELFPSSYAALPSLLGKRFFCAALKKE